MTNFKKTEVIDLRPVLYVCLSNKRVEYFHELDLAIKYAKRFHCQVVSVKDTKVLYDYTKAN